jgi:hypothetical protein
VISLPDIENGTKVEYVLGLGFHANADRLVVVILDSVNSDEIVACVDLGAPDSGTPPP